MMVVAFIGARTALLAATIALVQNDIKKVLAYSTVSQLGFMFLGVGVGAFTAGFFHVFTHAFFKACLFLGAGSVIHAMHARIHDDDKSQDMRNMGGLRKYMPLTYWTFVASTLAIIGFPLLSGFFSKDEILYRAYVNRSMSPLTARLTHEGHAPCTSRRSGSAKCSSSSAISRRDDDCILHVSRVLHDVLGRVPRMDDRSPVGARTPEDGRATKTPRARRQPRRRSRHAGLPARTSRRGR